MSYPRRLLLLALIITINLALFSGSALANNGSDEKSIWQPAKTWVFIVGLLEWKHSDHFQSFPKEGRRDAELAKFFRAQGVPADQMIYLQDNAATTARIESQLDAFLSKTRPGDLLFLYFCGHGYRGDNGETYFASYDASDQIKGWPVSHIINEIEGNFHGSRAFLTADCCYSGALAGAIKAQRTKVSYACLTSVTADGESTANWTFSDCLLDGLNGRAGVDLDNDGKIELSELAKYTDEDMTLGEKQRSAFLVNGLFQADTIVASAARKSDANVGKRIQVSVDKQLYQARILDAKGDQYRIHYLGWDNNYDEWINKSRTVTANRENAVEHQYRVGQSVEVEWQGRWYPATIMRLFKGKFYIHYTGYDKSWDEWVALDRLR